MACEFIYNLIFFFLVGVDGNGLGLKYSKLYIPILVHETFMSLVHVWSLLMNLLAKLCINTHAAMTREY